MLEEPEAEDARFSLDGDEVVRFASAKRDPARQSVRVRMRYERRHQGRVVADDSVEFGMRYFFRYELEHLLARAGFDSLTLYGGFDRRPYGSDASDLIFVARSAA